MSNLQHRQCSSHNHFASRTASLSTDESSAAQLALEPLWKLYEVCSPGADVDVKATMSKAVKSLSLTQVRPILPCLLLPIDVNQDLSIRIHSPLKGERLQLSPPALGSGRAVKCCHNLLSQLALYLRFQSLSMLATTGRKTIAAIEYQTTQITS